MGTKNETPTTRTSTEAPHEPTHPVELQTAERQEFARRVEANKAGHTGDIVSGK